MHGLRIFLFGGMRVIGPRGAEVPLPHGSRLLLAILAVSEGPTVSRPEFAAALWPELGTGAADRGLGIELRRLARSLTKAGLRPTAVVDDRGSEVALRPQVWCDAMAFDALYEDLPLPLSPGGSALTPDEAAGLAEVMALVRGPFMAGFADPWSEEARRGYDARVKAALEALLDAAERRGHWQEAIAWAERLLSLDPIEESVIRVLMRSHWQAGDPRSALRHYARLSDVLRYRHGTEPEEETSRLYDRIVAESAGPTATQVRPTPPRTPAAGVTRA